MDNKLSGRYFPVASASAGGPEPGESRSIPSMELETILPLNNNTFLSLLMKKDVKDWQAMTDYLVSRHLLLLPSLNLFPPKPEYVGTGFNQRSNEYEETALVRETRAAKQAAHLKRVEDSQRKAAAKKANKAKAHLERMDAQKLKAQLRKVNVRKAEAERQAAAEKRTAIAVKAKDLSLVKTGKDAKRFLETRLAEVAARHSDASKLSELSLMTAPVVFRRLSIRPVRPPVVAKDLVQGSTDADQKALDDHFTVIRMVEHRLSYIFNEDNGWTKVLYRKKPKSQPARKRED